MRDVVLGDLESFQAEAPPGATIGIAAPLGIGELLGGDAEQPRVRGAGLRSIAATARERRGESLCGEVRGELGIARAPPEERQQLLDLMAVEELERRRVRRC